MSSAARAIWENAYSLLVEDGQLAVGAIVALAITWIIAHASPEGMRDIAGWALLALVIVLMLSSLYRAGRSALRRSG